MNWTQPICEADWIDQNSHEEDDTLLIKQPTRLRDPRLEWCAWCSKPTISGILYGPTRHLSPTQQRMTMSDDLRQLARRDVARPA